MFDKNNAVQHLDSLRIPNILKIDLREQMLENDRIVIKKPL